jgi:hypothetical protein
VFYAKFDVGAGSVAYDEVNLLSGLFVYRPHSSFSSSDSIRLINMMLCLVCEWHCFFQALLPKSARWVDSGGKRDTAKRMVDDVASRCDAMRCDAVFLKSGSIYSNATDKPLVVQYTKTEVCAQCVYVCVW